MQKIVLKINNMTCASCARIIEKAFFRKPGIQKAQVNFASKKAIIEYDEALIDIAKIKEIIKSVGYEIEENEDHSHHHKNEGVKNFIWPAILSLPLILGMFFKIEIGREFLGQDLMMWLNLILGTIVVFYFGRNFHKVAFRQLLKFQFGMDTLVSLGTLAAYFYSLWAFFAGRVGYLESAAIIITLIILGRYFESLSTGKASEAMKKLMEMESKTARIISDGKEREASISEVKVGEIILVKPGEKIPLDGIVVEGSSNINESMLTGESMPVEKKTGSQVFGATMNEDGVLKIKVTKIQSETMFSEIIKTVEEAQLSKAPIQKLADKISGIFVPIIIAISLITFFSWFIISGIFSSALINAISVLVIACPCALGLATPTAIMVGAGKGFRNGILFKSGESFEKIKNISMVVFDKTGTLTKGMPEVEKIVVNENVIPTEMEGSNNESKILKIAASLAKNSEHPLSKAVIKLAKEKNITLQDVNDFKEIKGKGIMADCTEHKTLIMLGNIKLLEDNEIDTTWAQMINSDDNLGIGTRLFIVHNSLVIGVLIIADEIRGEAKKIIKELKDMHLKVAMISGDNKKTAESVGKNLGIENIIAEVLPSQKAEEIKKFQSLGEKVIFVGDGINDAPSLIQADLGFAMGAGTDIAKEAGQVILMQNNLDKVVEAVKISKATYQVIKQNLFWAFFYNVIAIPLAAFGFLNPIIAAGAMSFSSVSVVMNSLRIYRK